VKGEIVSEVVAQRLASKYRKTPAQVALRWDLQHEVVTIPKSTRPHRIAENADIFDFELSETEMKELDALDEGRRTGPDPDNFDF
jgi:diketogulonate reductase-like aldo/keto reductase